VILLLGLYLTAQSVKLPADESSSGLGVAAQELLGKAGGTDFLVDYASAYALTHNSDAYDISAVLIARVGQDWPVGTANPHPPTILTLDIPLTLVSYHRALAAWVLAMILALIATLRLLGAPWPIAIAGGVAFSLTMPGAYGIGNPVPLIGLGIALAYRWRDQPVMAGLGMALAAAPKVSALVLVLPFLFARRIQAAIWAVGGFGVLAVVPMLFRRDVWSRYLDAGVQAVNLNQARTDNAALSHLAQTHGIPELASLAAIGLAAVVLVLASRDTYWPTVWLVVASLPIAWMYSLLTFLPLGVWIVRRSPAGGIALVTVATGLTLATPPLGRWPVVVWPVVTALVYLAVLTAPPVPGSDFWLPKWLSQIVNRLIPRAGDRR
jgi:hypothetical protein